jgi:hypothetical protein
MDTTKIVHARTLVARLNEMFARSNLWTEKPEDEYEKKALSNFGRFTVQSAVRCCLSEEKTPNCCVSGDATICTNVVSLSQKEFGDLVGKLEEIATSKTNLTIA